MSAKKIIRVIPVAGSMVPDYHAQRDLVLRFHGHKHAPKHGKNGAFVHSPDVVEINIAGFEREYIEEVKAGTLVCADAESAKICGVKFAPSEAPAAAPPVPVGVTPVDSKKSTPAPAPAAKA